MVDAIKITNSLIEAYNGYYEDERVVQQDDGSFKVVAEFSKEDWDTWIKWKIISDTAEERLTRYLEWNGIIGFTSTIFTVATGKLS